jgi:hypothetical protein
MTNFKCWWPSDLLDLRRANITSTGVGSKVDFILSLLIRIRNLKTSHLLCWYKKENIVKPPSLRSYCRKHATKQNNPNFFHISDQRTVI